MRVIQAATLTAAALFLTSVASAQGLGDAAAREREKRKAEPGEPAKVYTEGDIATAPASATPDLPATADPAAVGGQPATEGETPVEGTAAAAEPAEDQAEAEEEAWAKAEEDWRQRLDQARKEEASYKDTIDKLQFQLNDTSSGLYTAGRAANAAALAENKQKLAETQTRIAALEDEGRRNRYR